MSHTHLLTGLDGSNPLGFLAALGALLALDSARAPADPTPRLAWRLRGRWTAELSTHLPLDALVSTLDADRAACTDEPALHFTYGPKATPDLKPAPEELRAALTAWLADVAPDRRQTLDWFTGFAAEGALDNGGATKPTPLHFTAGKQLFLNYALELVADTTPADLEQALLGPWRYDRPLPVLGWDCAETRDHALRAINPASLKKLGNPGADWLALRGLLLLPCTPRGGQQRAPLAHGSWKRGCLRWALWDRPLSLDELRPVLTLDLKDLDPRTRARRGLSAAFEATIHRSDQGGYGSLSAPRPL